MASCFRNETYRQIRVNAKPIHQVPSDHVPSAIDAMCTVNNDQIRLVDHLLTEDVCRLGRQLSNVCLGYVGLILQLEEGEKASLFVLNRRQVRLSLGDDVVLNLLLSEVVRVPAADDEGIELINDAHALLDEALVGDLCALNGQLVVVGAKAAYVDWVIVSYCCILFQI